MKRLARVTATALLGSAGARRLRQRRRPRFERGRQGQRRLLAQRERVAVGDRVGVRVESESSGPLEGDIVGKGYAFDLPDGWSDTSEKAKKLQATIDTAATEDTPSNGFADNLNVGYNNVGEATLEQLEATVPDQLKNLVKEGDLDVLPHTDIAGVEAIHHRAPAALGKTKYFLEQYAAITDAGNLAIVTFSFSRDVPESERNDVISTVIDSWQWAD